MELNFFITELPKLNLPNNLNVKLKKIGSKITIFDPIRLKYIHFTLEEYVRQMWILYFIIHKNFKRSAFIIEKKIRLYHTIKRIDMIVMDNYKSPNILIECKATNVIIVKKIFEQVARYNLVVQAKNILITNGLVHYFFSFNSTTQVYTKKNFNTSFF